MKNMGHIFFVGMGALFLSLFFLIKNGVDQKTHEVSELLISPERAQEIACNRLQETKTGVELFHPNHHVEFEKQGVLFVPRKGPNWSWQLESIGTQENHLQEIALQSIKPKIKTTRVVEYHYGDVIEEYHAKANAIEQRFVLEEPLDLNGEDLVIQGCVQTEGEFKKLEEGWAWEDGQGRVTLGDVTVFDAQGKTLLAHMNVTANQTQIVVDAKSLAQATYPVTVDPEIGANDFRISDMGLDGNSNFIAVSPAVAYNPQDNEYLVVWRGDDNVNGLVNNEFEIFGQRIDASTGAQLGGPTGNDFRISDMGDVDGETTFGASSPDVAYNLTDNEYLVVWQGNDGSQGLADNEMEVYGQRLSASGIEIGTDIRISDMGADGDALFGASNPKVAYNSADNEYLVVWRGDDDAIEGFVNNEFEIFGQLLDSAGAEIGNNDFRISDMGVVDGDATFGADMSAVAYNSTDNEYLVVWSGDDDEAGLVDNESEIYGQLLDSSGVEIGSNDFRISDMGPDGNHFFNANGPAVAYNSADNEYLVVWSGDDDDDMLGLVDNEFEIFGQRLDSAGAEIGGNDFRISDMGMNGAFTFSALHPLSITYSSVDNEYLVVWYGDDEAPGLVDNDLEIFGQLLTASGLEKGENDFRISDMGPNGVGVTFGAFSPDVAHNSADDEYLIVWHGDDNEGGLVDGEFEIFGQRFRSDTLTSDIDQLFLLLGGTQQLFLDFGPDFAGQTYLVLGSLVGTSPGTPLGGKNIPLNIGAYFLQTLNNPNSGTLPNGFGILDAHGRATVQFVLPPGVTLPPGVNNEVNHAAVVIDIQQTSINVTAVSNPVPCTLE